MRLACRATLLVYRAVAQSLTPGMTTADVHSLVAAAYHRVGFEGEASLNVDEFTALPHGSAKPQTLREGSILMLDDGCRCRGIHLGHHADLCPGQTDRQDESCLRPCAAGAIRGVGGCASGRADCRRGCGSAQGHRRWRLWPGVQVLYAPRGSRHRHGHARVALFRAQRYVRLGSELRTSRPT